MITLRLFAQARQRAGTGRIGMEAADGGDTVGSILSRAVESYGDDFEEILASCKVWLNGEQADPDDHVADGDEVAVLPPVSGG